jgi:XisH protein
MAKDLFHKTVKTALENDGWTITHDPYFVKSLKADYEVDLAAEKIIAAEKGSTKIAVEVKSFIKPSFAHEFHSALGQYLNYLALMKLQEPDRVLYLAVTKEIFDNNFSAPSTDFVVKNYGVKLLIFNPLNFEIEQWLEN